MDKYWQTLRSFRRVGKLRGVIEIPLFSEPSGWPIACLDVGYSTTNTKRVLAPNLLNTTDFTVEFWIKVPFQKTGTVTRVLEWISGALVTAWTIEVDGSGNLVIAATSTTPATYTITTPLPIGEWCHVAFVWDTVNFNAIYAYINGVVVANTAMGNIPLRASNPMYLYLGSNTSSGSYPFSIAHLRYWDDIRTADEIRSNMSRPLGVSSTDLLAYWKFADAVGSTTAVDSGSNAYSWTGLQSNFVFNHSDGIPLMLGIEFAAAQFPIDTDGRAFSFKYPIIAPYDAINFTPVIRWVDSSDVVYRYALWVADIDYSPPIDLYHGQVIPDGAVLEIFNVDGEESVDLTVAIDMLTSLLHIVTSPFTTTPETDALLTVDTQIGAAFPLVFPFEFDTTLTF